MLLNPVHALLINSISSCKIHLLFINENKLQGSMMINSRINFVYVVVNFLSQAIFVFLLFLGMVTYVNEVETQKK